MKAIVFMSALALTGCATKTYKERFLQSMATGAAAGAAYGMSKQENRNAHATMWAAVGAAAGALATVFLNDPDMEAEKLRADAAELRDSLDRLNEPKVEARTTGFFGSKVPEKYRALINPGEWRVSKLDQWIEEDENRLIHQDMVMELVPPTLNPVSRPTNK